MLVARVWYVIIFIWFVNSSNVVCCAIGASSVQEYAERRAVARVVELRSSREEEAGAGREQCGEGSRDSRGGRDGEETASSSPDVSAGYGG